MTDEEDFTLLPIPIKLNTTNYHQWRRRVTIALKAAGKFDYVNGAIKQPHFTDPTHSAWARSNTTVLVWLLDTLADPTTLVGDIHRFDTAAELLAELEKSLGRPNPAGAVDLQTQIFSIRQAKVTSLLGITTPNSRACGQSIASAGRFPSVAVTANGSEQWLLMQPGRDWIGEVVLICSYCGKGNQSHSRFCFNGGTGIKSRPDSEIICFQFY